MNDAITARGEVLEQLVSLRKRHREIVRLQRERLEGVDVDSPSVDMEAEREALEAERSVIEGFVSAASGFPAYVASPVTVAVRERRGFRLPLGKPVETLVEKDDPAGAEAVLQDARLRNLADTFTDDLADRRMSLQHLSYRIKRTVVGLNQSVTFSISEDDARQIERERHVLEGLASALDRSLAEIAVAARRVPRPAEESTDGESRPLLMAS